MSDEWVTELVYEELLVQKRIEMVALVELMCARDKRLKPSMVRKALYRLFDANRARYRTEVRSKHDPVSPGWSEFFWWAVV